MKPDKLEQFILDNREAFDDQRPSPESWDKVKDNIRPVHRINWTARMVRIAAAVVIFVSSYIFIDYTLNRDNSNSLAKDGMEVPYDNIPVLMEAKVYYSGLINNMENEVYRMAGDNSPIKQDIKTEFEELDKIFNELKNDLRDDADNQEVIEAMIQNYRIKLQILEEILSQLKNAETPNTPEHENNKVL